MASKKGNKRAVKALNRKLARIEKDLASEALRLRAYYGKRQSHRDPYITSHEILAVKVSFYKVRGGQDDEVISIELDEGNLFEVDALSGVTILYKLLYARLNEDEGALIEFMDGATCWLNVQTASQRRVDL